MSDLSKIIALAILVIVILIVLPVIAVWCLNSIMEAGGSTFYIEHTFWNYWLFLVALFLVNSNSSTGKSS